MEIVVVILVYILMEYMIFVDEYTGEIEDARDG